MQSPDVNVLVYAFRPASEHHEVCRAWFSETIAAESPFAVSTQALGALVRITTNSRSPAPSSIDDAFAFCAAILAQPNCVTIEPGERHWAIFERIAKEGRIMGPMVSDAWYAALAIEHGCEWVTLDRDFARFPGLRWSTPR
ncbi:MAG: type II toxin-antitoxin system VapC family toxin [Parvularculaceae bacterium]